MHGSLVPEPRGRDLRVLGLVVGVATIAALMAAHRARVPVAPEHLRPGTFALRLKGVVGFEHVVLYETVTGTACRAGNAIRLDNRRFSRRILLILPAITEANVRYELAFRGTPNSARAHLNVPVGINHGMSLSIIGETWVADHWPDDVQGTIEARIAQEYVNRPPEMGDAIIRGVFRANTCPDFRAPNRSGPPAL
jgi:hypothetical protein